MTSSGYFIFHNITSTVLKSLLSEKTRVIFSAWKKTCLLDFLKNSQKPWEDFLMSMTRMLIGMLVQKWQKNVFWKLVWYLTEAVTRRFSLEKVFLEISQNSQESTCARVCARDLRPAVLSKKRIWHRCFPVNFVKFLTAGLYDEIFLSQVVKFFFRQFPFNI